MPPNAAPAAAPASYIRLSQGASDDGDRSSMALRPPLCDDGSMQRRGGWLPQTDPFGVRLLQATVIVTAIILVVVPPIALLAILDVPSGRAYTGIGIVFLVTSCLCVGAGVHQARTGQPFLGRFKSIRTYHSADPGTVRLTGRLLVITGLLNELGGLLDVAHTRSVEVVATTATLAVVSTALIIWLARRPAPNQPA